VQYLKGNPFPPSAISFYAGDLGLLYVGYRLGYGDRAMQRRLAPDIAWLLGRVDRGLASQHSLDMIGGNAGAIGPLLFIANRYRLRRRPDAHLALPGAEVDDFVGTLNRDIAAASNAVALGEKQQRADRAGVVRDHHFSFRRRQTGVAGYSANTVDTWHSPLPGRDIALVHRRATAQSGIFSFLYSGT